MALNLDLCRYCERNAISISIRYSFLSSYRRLNSSILSVLAVFTRAIRIGISSSNDFYWIYLKLLKFERTSTFYECLCLQALPLDLFKVEKTILRRSMMFMLDFFEYLYLKPLFIWKMKAKNFLFFISFW